ncbi:hypothetical protein LNP00_02215 [Fructobacillus sp. M158]|nr:hypothetical protein [Fructobacillus parabroussonetiae]MCK8617184.1 hypothetical protein [Fructobacillus parabroussonetiae]
MIGINCLDSITIGTLRTLCVICLIDGLVGRFLITVNRSNLLLLFTIRKGVIVLNSLNDFFSFSIDICLGLILLMINRSTWLVITINLSFTSFVIIVNGVGIISLIN